MTHGDFSESIIKSMELIFGHHDKLEALTLNHGDDVRELLRKVREKSKELDDGDGVIRSCRSAWRKSLQCDCILLEGRKYSMRDRTESTNVD